MVVLSVQVSVQLVVLMVARPVCYVSDQELLQTVNSNCAVWSFVTLCN